MEKQMPTSNLANLGAQTPEVIKDLMDPKKYSEMKTKIMDADFQKKVLIPQKIKIFVTSQKPVGYSGSDGYIFELTSERFKGLQKAR